MEACFGKLQNFCYEHWVVVKGKYDRHLGKWCNPVLKVAKNILIAAGGTVIFYRCPNFFFMGITVAAAFPDHMKTILDRVKRIWENNHVLLIAFFGLSALCLAFVLPNERIASIAFLSGSMLGLYLVNNSKPPPKAII